MTRLLKPTHLILGTFLLAASASSKATVEEYQWGRTVCTPTSSQSVWSPFEKKMVDLIYAPAASCKCLKDTREREKVEVNVNQSASTITIFRTDKEGKKLLWRQFKNCKILSLSDWDCSERGTLLADEGTHARRMSSHEALFLTTFNGRNFNFIETVGTLKGKDEDWGRCLRKGGWSLKGIFE